MTWSFENNEVFREKNKEFLFIDEFLYSSHSNKQYGWCNKSENSIYYAPINTFKMSFIVLFSKVCI